jgi:putative aldouronate transport system substrate-binding protein
MKKTLFMMVALLLTLTLLLGGCAKTATPTESTPVTSAPVVSEAPTSDPVATLPAGDGPLGKYDPPIKVKAIIGDPQVQFPEGDSLENNVWTKYYKEKLGIEIEYLWAGADPNGEKMSLAVASNNLPDIFYVDKNLFTSLVTAGKLSDITQAYNDYAGDFLKDVMTRPGSDAALKLSSYEGKLYAIPWFLNCTDDTKNIWIRYDWLQKLGLPEPKTMQDVLNIAEAFVKNDPDGNGQADTIGFPMYSDALGTAMLAYFNGFHAYPGIWMKGSDGKLVSGITQASGMKAALAKLNELYKNNIIDKNYASLKLYDDIVPLMTGNRVGVIFGSLWDGWWPLGDMKVADPTCEWRSYPVMSIDSTPAKAQTQTVNLISQYVVKAGFEHPEAIIKMTNLCNETLWKSTPEGFAKYGYDATGNQPWQMMTVYFEYPGKNYTVFQKTSKALETGDTSQLNGEEMLNYNWMVDYRDKGDMARWGIWLCYGPNSSCAKMDYYLNNDLYMFNEFYGNAPQSMVDNTTILDKLYGDYTLKIINGEYSVDKYDEFVSEWYKQGGQQVTDDVNAWYETMK